MRPTTPTGFHTAPKHGLISPDSPDHSKKRTKSFSDLTINQQPDSDLTIDQQPDSEMQEYDVEQMQVENFEKQRVGEEEQQRVEDEEKKRVEDEEKKRVEDEEKKRVEDEEKKRVADEEKKRVADEEKKQKEELELGLMVKDTRALGACICIPCIPSALRFSGGYPEDMTRSEQRTVARVSTYSKTPIKFPFEMPAITCYKDDIFRTVVLEEYLSENTFELKNSNAALSFRKQLKEHAAAVGQTGAQELNTLVKHLRVFPEGTFGQHAQANTKSVFPNAVIEVLMPVDGGKKLWTASPLT
ncbi:uncharacterized protein RCC_02272 [Ramularia collo-cygni]|uniref:Uncharacterized protein n=1 Tax=Ramularia collo-cygni TaxID=112498 RepID=A0A2D3V4L5_9PEZI|nr:uncharacterized protein RCC_02272 [Ramularia collo-cygni]CZT16429.1 uncharacterized protein RCC_02272 [Ramularia collo-cygni]